jgi:dipeptidase E
MKLLLLSNSTTQGFTYLEHALTDIRAYFGESIKNIAFIPYAGVTVNYNDYTKKVADVFQTMNYNIMSVHTGNPKEIIKNADAIAVGGGNTFRLLEQIYTNDIFQLLIDEVKNGKQYIGWSAGSNMACPTICTTNDMPVIEPQSFNALNLVTFQINPHYLDAHPEGHHGETREQRIMEYIEINPDKYVVGLREGSTLKIVDNKIELLGTKSARIFKKGIESFEVNMGESLEFLL